MTLELSLQLQEAGGSRKLTVAIGGAGRSSVLPSRPALLFWESWIRVLATADTHPEQQHPHLLPICPGPVVLLTCWPFTILCCISELWMQAPWYAGQSEWSLPHGLWISSKGTPRDSKSKWFHPIALLWEAPRWHRWPRLDPSPHPSHAGLCRGHIWVAAVVWDSFSTTS